MLEMLEASVRWLFNLVFDDIENYDANAELINEVGSPEEELDRKRELKEMLKQILRYSRLGLALSSLWSFLSRPRTRKEEDSATETKK